MNGRLGEILKHVGILNEKFIMAMQILLINAMVQILLLV